MHAGRRGEPTWRETGISTPLTVDSIITIVFGMKEMLWHTTPAPKNQLSKSTEINFEMMGPSSRVNRRFPLQGLNEKGCAYFSDMLMDSATVWPCCPLTLASTSLTSSK